MQDQIQELREALCKKTGLYRISENDCERLSIAIFNRNGTYVSKTNIKRIFGLLDAPKGISRFTLDSLREYAWGLEQASPLIRKL